MRSEPEPNLTRCPTFTDDFSGHGAPETRATTPELSRATADAASSVEGRAQDPHDPVTLVARSSPIDRRSSSDGAYSAYKERVREAIDIVDVIGETVALSKNLSGKCPFHEDAHPSFSVHRQGQFFKCFGCNAGGDVFAFVMRRDSLSFPEAVDFLARRAGIAPYHATPEERARQEHNRRLASIRNEATAYYVKQLTPAARAYLNGRGIPDEVIARHQVGWADGTLWTHLKALGYEAGPCIETGLVKRDENGRMRDHFYNRLVFPVQHRGQTVQMTARVIDSRQPKYLHLPGPLDHLFNEIALHDKAPILVEGPPDVLSLEVMEHEAAALLGAGQDPERITERLKGAERVYICLDGDAAGRSGALRLGQALGMRARIISMPEGKDPNDILLSGGKKEMDALVAQAKDPITYQIEQIDPETPRIELSQRLAPVLDQIAGLDEPTAESFLEIVRERFKLSREQAGAYRSELKKKRKAAQSAPQGEAASVGVETLWEDLRVLSPAQDFAAGTAYFCVYLSQRITLPTGAVALMRRPFLFTSDREQLLLDPATLAERRLRLSRPDVYPGDVGRWSTSTDAPNGVSAFLDGRAHVDVLAVFDEIAGLFRTYLEYPNPLYYLFLALWVVGTYLFMLFESYPYVYLHGTKRSGKTRTMEVAAPLAFNGMLSASMSDAAMFRSSESDRCTLFHDEAAKYHGKQRGETSERLEIFNTGYKKDGAVLRCEGDNHIPVRFSTYAPKMLASIEGLDSTSADRTITLHLLRARRSLPRFTSRRLGDRFSRLRDSLYVLAMTHHRDVARIYESQAPIEGLRDREEELWSPILALAEFVDATRLEREPATADSDLLYPRMLELAAHCRAEKQRDEEEESPDQRILIGLTEFERTARPVMTSDGTRTQYFLASQLLDALQNQGGMTRLTQTGLTKALKRLRVLIEKEDKKTLRIDPSTGQEFRGGVQLLCYRIDTTRLQDIQARYVSLDSAAQEAF